MCTTLYVQVSSGDTAQLVAQLGNIDVTLVNELFDATTAAASESRAPVAATLAPCTSVTKLRASPPADVTKWRDAGLSAIAKGQVAALILAGGQGTRLGFDRPKGEYDILLPSHKTLFQLQAERIQRCRELAAAASGASLSSLPDLPVYVMTSPMTDKETREFWTQKNYFGLPRDSVMFFCQGTLPCLTPTGKIMLETGARVAEAPDGNGGIYRALHLSGALADMQARGVIGVHVWAIDNAVVVASDPVFIGYCLTNDADVGSKSCPKSGPHEKVGVLCLRDGQYTVVEYSEMDKDTAELRDENGELAFNAGNICIHYYSTSFLAHEASPAHLPKVYHLAKKSIPCAHPDTGKTMTKAEMAGQGNNGIKLESFIFDVFPAAKRMAVLEIERSSEFSPIKNAPGSADDSPDTARAIIASLHRGWLTQAGAVVEGPIGAACEVSPLVSFGGEGLHVFAGVTLQAPLLMLRSSEPLPVGVEDGSFAAGPVAGVEVATTGAGLHVYRLTSS